MLVDRRSITHLHWQLALDRSRLAAGEVVVGLADLEQEIRSLILTPKGSVPLNPEMGSDLAPYIDRPPAVGVPAMTREVWAARTTWCKRIVVEDGPVTMVAFHHFAIPVFRRPVEGIADDGRRTEVDYVAA